MSNRERSIRITHDNCGRSDERKDEGQVAIDLLSAGLRAGDPIPLIGAVTRIQLLPGLPVASLIVVCPATTALILVYREDGAAGAKALLVGAFDYRRIRKNVWYALILFLMPGIMTLSLGVMRWTGTPVQQCIDAGSRDKRPALPFTPEAGMAVRIPRSSKRRL